LLLLLLQQLLANFTINKQTTNAHKSDDERTGSSSACPRPI